MQYLQEKTKYYWALTIYIGLNFTLQKKIWYVTDFSLCANGVWNDYIVLICVRPA